MTQRLQIVILIVLTVTIYIATSARPSLLDDADASHAMAAQAMLERGDWAVLHMNGIAWLEKPPFHYWLVAASFALLGETAFAVRLPLALAVTGLVFLIYVFGSHFFGGRAGFYAALVMCTSVGTFLFTRVMIPEAIYALEFTAIFYLFLRAWTGTLDVRIAVWAVPALIGLAALTRAAIGPLFPLTIIGLFVLLTGGWRRLFTRGVSPFVVGALAFAVVAVPWHLVAGLRTPGFFWFYFINEQVRRALGTRIPLDYATVPLRIWWPAHLVWFFPWSVFLLFALREVPGPRRWRASPDPADQARLFLFSWAALILLFFTVVTGSRLEYYAFGSWPAISLLVGLGLARAEERQDAWLPRLQALLAIIGVLVAGILGALVWISRDIPATQDLSQLLASHPTDFYRLAMANFFDLTPQAFAALRVPAVGAALALSIGFSIAWWLRKQGRTWAPNLVAALAMLAFFHSANLAYATFEPRLSSRPLADELLKWLHPSDRLVIYGEFDAGSSLTFYTRRQALIYNGRYNGLAFGSYFPDAPPIFLTDRDFPGVWDGPARVFMFVPPDQREQALQRLPLDRAYFVAERGGKALFVNRPLEPGQLSLGALVARPISGAVPQPGERARNAQRDHLGDWLVALEHAQALSRGGAIQ
jgi:4-amino-4-deoxy-L-arabinose transferase-like glycosyltransferase